MSAPHDAAAHSTHPVNTTTPANPPLKGDATAAHPPPQKPDPTLESNDHGATQGGLTTPRPSAAAELASLKSTLKSSLRQFENFPEPGILFEDILPIFANPELHEGLLRGLELSVEKQFGATGRPDVVVGLDARGFLFGPSLALRLGASFVPVRKRGKLPGPCETAEYQKEYGSDFFQMQADAVKSGQKVLIVDDIIATGGSASAAGSLVSKLGGTVMGYLFILELDFLKGRDKLDAPLGARAVPTRAKREGGVASSFVNSLPDLGRADTSHDNDRGDRADAPLSTQAIVAGPNVFVSGQIPADTKGNLIEGSIADKTKMCCENIKGILTEAGVPMDRIVKVNVFLDDMANFAEMNGMYEQWFPHKPARSCVAVKQLPKGVPVEIECIAYTDIVASERVGRDATNRGMRMSGFQACCTAPPHHTPFLLCCFPSSFVSLSCNSPNLPLEIPLWFSCYLALRAFLQASDLMHLLQAVGEDDFSLVDFFKDIPPYAILSHTWGADDDEVTFKDIYKKKGKGKTKPGYAKLKFCAAQAGKDGIQYFWVDTCCIDKSSSTELSEAINSMFKWYQNSSKCYVFLSDVSRNPRGWNSVPINKSRWFTRGWTLQELLAPKKVHFFDVQGRHLGDRVSLLRSIAKVTGISASVLQGSAVSSFSVDERFSWAKGRDTKREEDAAYCLMGLFGVHMPLLYGEGKENAFRRLEKEICSREQSSQAKTTGFGGDILSPIQDVDQDETASIGDDQTDSFVWDKHYTSSYPTTLGQDRSLYTQQMLSTDDQIFMTNTNYDPCSCCPNPRTDNGESGFHSPTNELFYPHHEANENYATQSDNKPEWSPTMYTLPDMYTPPTYRVEDRGYVVYDNEDPLIPQLPYSEGFDGNGAYTSHFTVKLPPTNNTYTTIVSGPRIGPFANEQDSRRIWDFQRCHRRGEHMSRSTTRRSNIAAMKPASGRVNKDLYSAVRARQPEK
ncbi:adenine phosphoribosyltransferase [Stemphylium lycopersici]|nr:adenine phosphoribosyltransferase [Stemphylium lycopersici]